MKVILDKMLLFIGLMSLIITGCERILGGEDDRLVIRNNYNERIYAYAQTNHPDTTISSYNPASSKENYEVLSHSEKKLISHSWEQMVTRSKSDTLMIFLYNAQTLETIPWEKVVKEYLILKRYDLSLEDLEKQNWTVTFP